MSCSTFSVSRGTLALALHDQVTPSLPSSLAIASARGRLSVKVSSSKKNSFTCGKCLLRPGDLLDHMADAARAVAMAADGLRPQAEGAARFAAAAGIERDVGVLQIADEVILDPQVALVDRRDERQLVHVLEDRRGPCCGRSRRRRCGS